MHGQWINGKWEGIPINPNAELGGKPASMPGMTEKETCQFLLAKSTDDGKSWSEPVVVTREIGAQQTYPYMIERTPGEIWLQPGAYGTPLVVKFQEKDFLTEGKLKLLENWP